MLKIINSGYSLPFLAQSPPFYAKHNSYSLRNKSFVDDSIEDLWKNGYVGELISRPYWCKPVQEGEKLRLVLDLSRK